MFIQQEMLLVSSDSGDKQYSIISLILKSNTQSNYTLSE